MATLDELLAEEAAGERSLDDLLADEGASPAAPTASVSERERQSPSQTDVPWHKRAATGFMDPLVGAGQLGQHVLPEKVSDFLRSPRAASIAGVFPVAGAAHMLLNAPAGGKQGVNTGDVDAAVAERERSYQSGREGKEGMDWWRVGGSVANPLSWAGGGPGTAGVRAGIKAGAQSGAFQAMLQPVASEGNFIWDKATQAGLGATIGGTLGGALQALRPAFSFVTRGIRNAIGASDDKVAQTASERITAQVLKEADVDPTRIDPNLYSAIKQEVADALKAGVDPDPRVMTNRADAGALPVPLQLTRGQAARDPMQFAWEQRVVGQQGVGEPLSDLLKEQNRALIANLNALGADKASQPFEASQQIIKHIEGVDEALRGRINQAYAAVRNSAGRPAGVSTQGFTQAARSQLTEGRPELAGMTGLADYLPEAVRKQYNDIATGKLPLTVDTIQFLDRAWGGVQRGAADDTTKKAIGALRTALNEAPIDDALGKESMQAYQAAKALAKQRFDLIDANPAYKAIVDGTKQAEPDKFFQTFVAGSNVAQLRGLKELIGPDNTQMLQGTLIGNLKRIALNRASDENGVFSQAAYNKVLQDPVQSPRMRELFADNLKTLDQLYRVGRVSENLIKIPAASKVNTSNTASAGANIVRDVAKSEAGQAITSMLPNWMTGAGRVLGDAGRRVEESKMVDQAVRPGVTAAPLPPAKPVPGMGRLSDLAARAGAISATTKEDDE
jgi:hypothetical protein